MGSLPILYFLLLRWRATRKRWQQRWGRQRLLPAGSLAAKDDSYASLLPDMQQRSPFGVKADRVRVVEAGEVECAQPAVFEDDDLVGGTCITARSFRAHVLQALASQPAQDLTLDVVASPATRLFAEAHALLGTVGLCAVPTLPPGSLVPSLAVPHHLLRISRCWQPAATAVWAEDRDTLACLAGTGTTLSNGIERPVCRIAFASDGPAFTLPVDYCNPPDFAALADEFADVLADPPPGLPAVHTPAFGFRIETCMHPMTRSRPMKRCSQGELDECSKQMAFLLFQGWIVPLCASVAEGQR